MKVSPTLLLLALSVSQLTAGHWSLDEINNSENTHLKITNEGTVLNLTDSGGFQLPPDAIEAPEPNTSFIIKGEFLAEPKSKGPASAQRVFTWGGESTGKPSFFIRIVKSGYLHVRFSDGTGKNQHIGFIVRTDFRDGEWHSFKVQARSDQALKLFVDEQLIDERKALGNYDTTYTRAPILGVALNERNGLHNPFHGKIRNLQIETIEKAD